MPRRGSENQANKRAATTAGGDDEDRLSALPDTLLQHVLSFLPSRLAVRTCVLARRWRHKWKSVPVLRLPWFDIERAQPPHSFVNHLLLLRDRVPLRECEIDTYEGTVDISPLILYALLFRVQVLRVDLNIPTNYMQRWNENLIAEQLVRLELGGVDLEGHHFLDFSSCPKLEVVKMNYCTYKSDILSQSLRHLSMIGCTFLRDSCPRIFTPRLISLELAGNHGSTPVLDCMPSLVTAFVRVGVECSEYCTQSYYGNCGSDDSGETTVHSDDSVLLDGLSNATNLELIADPAVYIFRKDMKKGPSFGKLKTLLLNEWCFAAKFGALLYFLQHSPVLEKLSLELYTTPEPLFETHGSCYQREPFLASKHLKVVEVKYHEDELLALTEVLKILITCGVPSKKIIVERMTSRISHSFSFEQTVKQFSP